MSAVYVQTGDTMDYTPVSDVAAGDVVRVGDVLGVALTPIPADTLGSLRMVGVFKVPKATGGGTALAQGEIVRWNPAGGGKVEPEDDSFEDLVFGPVWAAAGDGDTTVEVKLDSYLSTVHHSQIP